MNHPMELTDLTLEQALELGRKVLDNQRESALRNAEREAADQQTRFDREWAEPLTAAVERWPFLAGGIKTPKLDPREYFDGQLPGQRAYLVVEVPGLDTFEIALRQSSAGQGAPTVWRPDEPALRLAPSYLDQSVYGGEYYVGRDKKNSRMQWQSGEMALVLAVAESEFERRVELQLEADQKNQVRKDRLETANAVRDAAPTPAEHALFLVKELIALAQSQQEGEGD